MFFLVIISWYILYKGINIIVNIVYKILLCVYGRNNESWEDYNFDFFDFYEFEFLVIMLY